MTTCLVSYDSFERHQSTPALPSFQTSNIPSPFKEWESEVARLPPPRSPRRVPSYQPLISEWPEPLTFLPVSVPDSPLLLLTSIHPTLQPCTKQQTCSSLSTLCSPKKSTCPPLCVSSQTTWEGARVPRQHGSSSCLSVSS